MKIQILNELNNTENFVYNENFLQVISICGDNAETFSQGQFTTDIKALKREPNKVQISAWCNAKGRIIANFFIYFDSQQNKYFLILSSSKDSSSANSLEYLQGFMNAYRSEPF